MFVPQRVLIVEDEAVIALFLAEEFKKKGSEFCQNASSADNAVKIFKMGHFDLVVIDIHLNEAKNGFYVADEIRQISKLPIIFTSGYDETEIIESIANYGPSSFIKKPIEIDNLFETLQRVVSSGTDSES